jgi:tetratricopeptide (TPR) repeat protein
VAFSLFGKSQDLNKLAARAEAAAVEGRSVEAERLFREIIGLELSDQQQESGRRIVAQAFLELGEICEARGERSEAFQHYRRARELGAPLSAGAWAALAEGYAAKQSKSDHAIGAYLAYIHGHAPDTANSAVFTALEAACQVDESMKSAARKQALDLNRRVAAANSNLDFPYYYMAVAYLLDGNLAAAMTNLGQARTLNPNRAMTYYWMGACHLQQNSGKPQEAIESLSKFLSFPADSPRMAKRQEKAALELGKISGRAEPVAEGDAPAEPLPSGSGLDRAVRYCRNGRHAEALEILEPLYQSGSDTDTVLFYLGMALVPLRRYNEALDLWNKLLARHPGHEKLKANIFRVRYLLGAQLAAEENYAAATAEWEQYLAQFPADEETSKNLAELYLRRFCGLFVDEQAKACSTALLDRASALDPHNPRCDYYRALHHQRARALEQECASLLSLGKVSELENLLDRRPEPCVRYHLALAYAANDAIDQAVAQVSLALKQNRDYPGLRVLAFHSGLRQANLKLESQDWNAIASAVAVALEAGPPNPVDVQDLEPFRWLLPIAHVLAGSRQDAAEAWERELKKHPGNRAVLHNLAILYYWWAMREEASGGRGVDRLWAAAIAYWTLIVSSDRFWSEWKGELEQRWGIELRDADLQRLRGTFLEERFTRVFRNHSSGYKETSRPADARRHEDYLTMALLEKKSAEAWKETGARFPAGGFLYCRQIGVLPEILEEIDRLPDDQQHKLRIYFSPAELGSVLILLEETALPEKALERLARLPEKVRQGPDATYLRVRAVFESAQASGALEKAAAAFAEAHSLEPQWAPLKEKIGELLDSLAKQEATRLRQDNQIDEAIRLLDRLYALSSHAEIREYLCILCCDRGFQKLNENAFEDGRANFLKALALDSNNQRAKQAMCIAYNNEALALPDQEAKLKMLQKALEFNPNDQHVRENLGTALHDKALKIARGSNPSNAALDLGRAIGLLRTAALTLNPAVSEKWLADYIASGGQRHQDEMKKMPADLYRTVLESLSRVATQRMKVRN